MSMYSVFIELSRNPWRFTVRVSTEADVPESKCTRVGDMHIHTLKC